MPCTSKRSPERSGALRRALYVVTPAQRSRALLTAFQESESETTALAPASIISAYPPSTLIPGW